MLKRAITYLFLGTFVFLLNLGCSSSNSSSRYNKSQNNTKPTNQKTVRFSSEEDVKPQVSTYSNPSDYKEFDEEPIEEYVIDTKNFVKQYSTLELLGSSLTNREKVLFEIIKYLETPYQYGGESLAGIDCSGFTMKVFSKTNITDLPRTASQQFEQGEKIGKPNLEFGDLIFFDTTSRAYPGHVGIFLGNDLFAHASQSKGVMISSLESTYYKNRFVGGRRINNFEH